MYLSTEKKKEIFAKFGKSAEDCGSPEAQIALFTYRIQHLTEHMKQQRKDLNTQRSLVRLVGKRRRLLDYLKINDIERYRHIIKELNIRKQFFIFIWLWLKAIRVLIAFLRIKRRIIKQACMTIVCRKYKRREKTHDEHYQKNYRYG